MPRENYHQQLRSLQDELLVLASMVDKAIARSMDALQHQDVNLARQVLASDRTINEHRWRTEGDALPFERTDSYRSRRTRERLTRELLVSYLASLEIFVDDDSLYGMATLVRTRVPGMDDT